MNFDSRLSSVLHLLVHLMEVKEPLPSERLATALSGNPVVVRRIMAGLREASMVTSEKGHGGGWKLTADPTTLTIFDIYQALGQPSLFAIGNRSEHPECRIEQAVNAALDDTLQAATQLITERMKTLTLSALASGVTRQTPPIFCPRPQEDLTQNQT